MPNPRNARLASIAFIGALSAFTAACEASGGPLGSTVEETAPPGLDRRQMSEILESAQGSAPAIVGDVRSVGVLATGLTSTAAQVVYRGELGSEKRLFVRSRSSWRPGPLLDRRLLAAPHGGPRFTVNPNYPAKIAETRTQSLQLVDTWYLEHADPGTYFDKRRYFGSVFHAWAFEGSNVSGPNRYTVDFYHWGFTLNDGGNNWTGCYLEDEQCETFQVSGMFTYAADSLKMWYNFSVAPMPLQVTITGPTAVASGQQPQWQASATYGTGSYSYSWEYSQGGGSWQSVGSGATYSRSITGSDTNFYLRATAQSGAETATAYYWVEVQGGCGGEIPC